MFILPFFHGKHRMKGNVVSAMIKFNLEKLFFLWIKVNQSRLVVIELSWSVGSDETKIILLSHNELELNAVGPRGPK
jgi:hypothetical protein